LHLIYSYCPTAAAAIYKRLQQANSPSPTPYRRARTITPPSSALAGQPSSISSTRSRLVADNKAREAADKPVQRAETLSMQLKLLHSLYTPVMYLFRADPSPSVPLFKLHSSSIKSPNTSGRWANQTKLLSVKVQLVPLVTDSNVSLLVVFVTKPKYVVIDILTLPHVLDCRCS